MRVTGYDGLRTREIDPQRDGYCHPPQAKRTKCACGRTVEFFSVLDHGTNATRCACGRVHVKAPGSAFERAIGQPVRPGGRQGCPGTYTRKDVAP